MLRGKSTKKNPNSKINLTKAEIYKMFNTPLNVQKFQRSARKYYKTTRTANLLFISTPSGNKTIRINFDTDQFGYINITIYKRNAHLTLKIKPSYNRDVFVEIYNRKLL